MPSSRPDRPTVFTVCGLPGSGKTTLARRIAREHAAVCLSADALVLGLLGAETPVAQFPLHRQRAWETLWELAEQVLALDVSVVLDFSFYRREEREEFRRRAEMAGADFRMFYLKCSEEVLRGRLARRNLERDRSTFVVDDAHLEELSRIFEPPTRHEEPRVVQVDAEVDLD